VGVGAFALILAACGGAEPTRSRTIEPKTETVKSDDAEAQKAAPKNIEDALLTLNDMPIGWSEQSVGAMGGGKGRGKGYCNETLPQGSTATDGTRAQFTADPTSGPSIAHLVFRFEPGDASERMSLLLDSLNNCSHFRTKEHRVSVQGLAYENVGDESVAVRLIYKSQLGLRFNLDQVFWRQGDLAAIVIYASTSPDIAALKKWVDKADRKLVALLEGE